MRYILGMRVKTSVTLAEETVRAIDEVAGRRTNRSRFIEEAVLAHLERLRREARERRDLDILNQNAEALNQEVEEVLTYQAEP
jgi:Arc/MetJ-type ribon-helix-helix transcriptional regulator